jgi:hypothetical protein
MSIRIIEETVRQTRETQLATAEKRDYYAGKHAAVFLTQDFTNDHRADIEAVKDNRCRIIIDQVVDKMRVKGFRPVKQNDPLAQAFALRAWDLWQEHRMDARMRKWFTSCLVAGRPGAITVGFNRREEAKLYLQNPEQVAFERSEEDPDELLWASKRFWDGTRPAITIYLPDHTETWYSSSMVLRDPDASTYKLDPDTITPNALGATAAVAVELDYSDLDTAIPLQRFLNVTLVNNWTNDEYFAAPMRFILGVELTIDKATGKKVPPFGIDQKRLVFIPGAAEGDQAADIKDFQGHSSEHLVTGADAIRNAMTQATSAIPYSNGQPQSGESRIVEREPFTAKVTATCETFGIPVADIVSMQVALEMGIPADQAPALITVWESPEPRSDEIAVKKSKALSELGVPSEDILVRVWGWEIEEAQEIMKKAREEAALMAAEQTAQQLRAADAGVFA